MLKFCVKNVVKTLKYVVYYRETAQKMTEVCCFHFLLHFYYQIFFAKKGKICCFWQNNIFSEL